MGSRRHNEKLIAAGKVMVNGRVASLGDKADPNQDRIEVNGRPLQLRRPIYIKVHKPKGVISSTEDELEQGRPTVRELVPLNGHLFPIGRLDKQSEGLMLLTNDGALTHRLTHPRFGHEKIYRVAVEGKVSAETTEVWRRGVLLDGKKTAPAKVEILGLERDNSWLQITMHEGRKRQIRRVAASLGHPVIRLIREQIGPIRLAQLKPGQWQHLTEREVSQLIRAAFPTRRKRRK